MSGVRVQLRSYATFREAADAARAFAGAHNADIDVRMLNNGRWVLLGPSRLRPGEDSPEPAWEFEGFGQWPTLEQVDAAYAQEDLVRDAMDDQVYYAFGYDND